MKITSELNYDLQAYQERLGLVNFLNENGKLDGLSPSELDKVANYLLYAEDVDAEVELKQGSKKKVSYEELIESTLGETTVQKQKDLSIYKIPKPRIDRELDANIPFMKDLWVAIDNITEKYQYCKDVLEGKREVDFERKLIPTYQTKYFMREWMVEMRREQFLLKDCYRPVVTAELGFQSGVMIHDPFGMCIGDNIICNGDLMVDFGNWQHIYAMLKNYSGMKSRLYDDPYNPWWDIYDFLEELIDKVKWSPEHWHILIRKIDKIPNEQIADELFKINGKTYSVNYISTIWKQHISKQIVKYAYLWWKEHTHKPDGTLKNMVVWKVCPICHKTLYADELNFGINNDGTWKDICKDCIKVEKDIRNRKKEAKRNSKATIIEEVID